MFLHLRKSHVDVIQEVGRIIRCAKGKKRGYIILPVGVPAGVFALEMRPFAFLIHPLIRGRPRFVRFFLFVIFYQLEWDSIIKRCAMTSCT